MGKQDEDSEDSGGLDKARIGADFPAAHLETLDAWRLSQEPKLSRAEAVRRLVCQSLGLEPPPLRTTVGNSMSEAQQFARREEITRLYEELGTFAAVARRLGISRMTVKTIVTTHAYRKSKME